MFSLAIRCFLGVIALVGSDLVCAESRVIEDERTIPLLSPTVREKKILKIELSNGVQALLVSDPHAPQAAAGISVQVGSWSDPEERPGMAHLVEHLLFLGSESWPDAEGFHSFIRQHNGQTNASTKPTQTDVLFTVDPSVFEEGLMRLGDVVRAPLFRQENVDRETRVVHQEHMRREQNDSVRRLAVLKKVTHPSHPFSRPADGSAETLAGLRSSDIRDWHNRYYRAENMRLVVVGPQPLSQLQGWVENSFSAMPAGAPPQKEWQVMSGKNWKGTRSYAEPVKDQRTLSLYWEVPLSVQANYKTKPAELIAYVMGHEGEGSLLALLKEHRLATNLASGVVELAPKSAFFTIQVELTKKGSERIEEVLEVVFQQVALVRKRGVPQRIFEDYREMGLVRYQYPEQKSTYERVDGLLADIWKEPLSTFPESSRVISKYSPETIRDAAMLLNPWSVHIHLMLPEEDLEVVLDQEDTHFHMDYAIALVEDDLLERLVDISPDDQLALPKPNPFLPRSLLQGNLPKILVGSRGGGSVFGSVPELIANDPHGRAYVIVDKEVHSPKTYWSFELLSPEVDPANPTSMALTDLYAALFNEAVNHFRYEAELADMQTEIKRSRLGLQITCVGYQGQIQGFLEELFHHLRPERPSAGEFRVLKESLAQAYVNRSRSSAFERALEIVETAIYCDAVTSEEKLAALRTISRKRLGDFIQEFYAKVFVRALFYGAVDSQEALATWKMVQKALPSSPYLKGADLQPRIMELGESVDPILIEQKSDQPGQAAILVIEDEDFSFKRRAAQQLLATLMEAPFFHSLRTQQNTGYVVQTWAEEKEKFLFNFFGVESDTYPPEQLLTRFELFLEKYLRKLDRDQPSEGQFVAAKKSVITQLQNIPRSIPIRGALLWKLAFDYGDFQWLGQRVRGLEELTYEEWKAYARAMLPPNNHRRFAVMIFGTPAPSKGIDYHNFKEVSDAKRALPYRAHPRGSSLYK